MHSVQLSAIMFPGPRLKMYSKYSMRNILWSLWEMSFGLQNNVSVEPIACENPSVGSKFAANYPGRHLHISTRISHIFLSVSGYLVISRDLDNNWARREFTPIWSQSPSSWKYSNIFKWVLSIILIVKDLIDWVISMCFILNVINQQYFIQRDH